MKMSVSDMVQRDQSEMKDYIVLCAGIWGNQVKNEEWSAFIFGMLITVIFSLILFSALFK